ncbi:hypothetical protein MLD63_17840 [Paracoccus sp. TK19116]|uniref:Uncharacterized protein n=1 Tax=Paracoccus albicereus TaxID=2922394 RepID=A0ABT1MXP0_9RHOB|nr:hypothetical protein [Paracoccus albicereus]
MAKSAKNFSLDQFMTLPPVRHGNGGRLLAPEGAFTEVTAPPQTVLDRTTAAAKLILEEKALEKRDKTARLAEARRSRDRSGAC